MPFLLVSLGERNETKCGFTFVDNRASCKVVIRQTAQMFFIFIFISVCQKITQANFSMMKELEWKEC